MIRYYDTVEGWRSWHDATWDTDGYWITLGSDLKQRTTTWIYAPAVNPWTGNPNTEYYINIQAQDYLRYETDFTTTSVIIDDIVPDSEVTLPEHGGWISAENLETISGTCSDDTQNGSIKVFIRDLTRGSTYWTGTDWIYTTEGSTWVYSTNPIATQFRVIFPTMSWTNGNQYNIKTAGIDLAGNQETASAGNTSVIDSSAPVSGIQYPGNDSISRKLTVISGTCVDPKPGEKYGRVDDAQIYVVREEDGYYFNGTGWTGSVYWIGKGTGVVAVTDP
ncbi:unnamed protein product, partial [marine sediment metagenome]